jgi:predicted permease
VTIRDHLDPACRDVEFAVRGIRRSPGLSIAAIVTLALGIGANTAVFSLVHAVLLRPLPYLEPEALVRVELALHVPEHASADGSVLTGQLVQTYRAESKSLRDIAVEHVFSLETSSTIDLLGPNGAERLRGGLVTSNFFETLGGRPAIGRLFGASDEGAEAVAVLSDGYWRRRFGGDPSIIGRQIDLLLSGRREQSPRRFTVIGVLPRRFRFTYPRETEVWATLPWDAIRHDRAVQYRIIARLAPGATVGQSQTELANITERLDYGRARALVTPLTEVVAAQARPGVILLAAVAAIILIVACTNTVLLLFARAAERSSEIAIRMALGARRAVVGRQLLVDTAFLVGLGGTVGLALVSGFGQVLRAIVPSGIARGDEAGVDLPVITFTVALCCLLTLVCGLAPVQMTSVKSLHVRLQQSSRQLSGTPARARWQRLIVGTQVAVVCMLLVGAGLLASSYWHLRHVELGYDGGDVLTMEVDSLGRPLTAGWANANVQFTRDLLTRVRALPGVLQASVTTSVPMRGVDFVWHVGPVGGRQVSANMRSVDAAFFGLMGMRILVGRGFTDHDTEGSPPVAVVSASYSRLLWGDKSPLGQQLDLAKTRPTVVGVVDDVRYQAVRLDAKPAFYLPREQRSSPMNCLLVRTRADRTATVAAIREIVRHLSPTQPVERIATVDGIVAETLATDRFSTVTTGAFAGIALVLAASGLVGVVWRSVASRTRELAIRSALGASTGSLVRRTVGRELGPVVGGALAGLIGAFWLSRLLVHFLFQVSPLNPWVYTAAGCLLVAVAATGCYVPARRIARIDPTVALRAE